MQSPTEIRLQLDRLSARRTALWKELGEAHDPGKAVEVARLNERIDQLWLELRQARAHRRFGDTAAILAKARLQARIERDLETVESGAPRGG